VVVNSEHLRSIQLGRHDGDQQVHLIHNGIEIPTRTDTSRWLHDSLNIPAEALLIGCVGDLVAKKRTRDLIWALDLLRVIRPEIRLIIIGDGECAGNLARFAGQTSNATCVHFLGHRTDVQELMTQFFCLWQASEREGCSNAILEAMAQGVPVVASDTPGHRWLIQDDVTGRLVPSGDCAEFARKTNLLMADGEKAARLGHQAKQFVAEKFPLDRMINQFAQLYNSVCSPRLGQVA
jgi:glycosyltransferase involved in cell wall biosynthesis